METPDQKLEEISKDNYDTKNALKGGLINGLPVQVTKTVDDTTTTKNEYQPEVKDSTFWDKKAYKQCLWNFWLEERMLRSRPRMINETSLDDLSEIEMNAVWQVFNQIEADADKRFLAKDIPF